MKGFIYILAILALISCKKKEVGEPNIMAVDTFKSGVIPIACDDNFKRVINSSIDVFEALHNYEALIIPTYTTESNAVRLLVEDSVRLAIVTRDLTINESIAIKERKLLPRKFIIGFDGIAIVSNRMNPDSLISVSTLQKILTGEITEWTQINPDSPLGTIRIIFDNKDSGVVRYAVDSICRGKEIAQANLYALENYEAALSRLKDLPSSICLMGANFFTDENNASAREYLQDLRLMRVSSEENPTLANSYLPYAGDINREDYPFWRPIQVIITDPKSGLPSGFTHFLSYEKGQKIIMHSGLMPITDAQNRDIRAVDKDIW